MKSRLLFLTGTLLLLSACAKGGQTLTYSVLVRAPDAAKAMILMEATERMVARRLAAIGIDDGNASVIPQGQSGATLTLTVPDAAASEKMQSVLTEPFTFEMRIEQPSPAGSSEPSDWIETPLTGDTIEWVQAIGNRETGVVSIQIQFTADGQEALKTVFRENQGKNLGVFVRDLLVSKVTIAGEAVTDNVVISGVPSAHVAEVFADDVNVGLRVRLSPASSSSPSLP